MVAAYVSFIYKPQAAQSINFSFSSLSWPLFSVLQVRGSGLVETLGFRALQRFGQTDLADRAHTIGAHPQVHPLVLLHEEEPAVLKVRCERATGLDVGVGHLVTGDDVLSGDLANLGHGCDLLRGAKIDKVRNV